jgi:hypothetical protein
MNQPMNRTERRTAEVMSRQMIEAEGRMRARMAKTGNWPPWEISLIPRNAIRSSGWASEMTTIAENKLYAVLMRTITTKRGCITHLAIRSYWGNEVPWSAKQRIKNELIGAERHAVEVFPAQSQLIDAANMYHLWVYGEDYVPPFTLNE